MHQSNGYSDALARAHAAAIDVDPDSFLGAIIDAVKHGYDPSHLKSHEKSLLERAGASVGALEEMFHDSSCASATDRQGSKRSSADRSAENEHYRLFGVALQNMERVIRFMPDSIYAQTSYKRKCLEAAGYTHAYVGSREKVSLSRVSDARVGSMFKTMYKEYQKQQVTSA